MEQTTTQDAVRRSVTVPVPPDRAFTTFTDGMATWWPREYTWSRRTLETIGVEPRVGGHCYEIGPGGFHSDWGTVLAWEPPRRLVLAWQISPTRAPEPDPDRTSEVEVTFEPDGLEATRVEVEHRGFRRHGKGGDDYRAGLAAPEGWTLMLERYAAALA